VRERERWRERERERARVPERGRVETVEREKEKLEPTGEAVSDDTPPRAVLVTLDGPSAAVAPGCPEVAARSF